MINTNKISLLPSRQVHYEFAYRAKKEAQGPYIKAIWGWEEETQKWLFDKDWQEKKPMIIYYEDEPIGTIYIYRDERSIEIKQFFILPQFQNKGIGTFILTQLLEEAADGNKLTKITYLKGSPVASLYTRLGFRLIKERDAFCIMEKEQ